MVIIVFLLTWLNFNLRGQSGAEIIDYQTRISVDRNDIVIDRKLIIQINNQASDWIADISVPFQDGDILDIIDATITDHDGKVVRTLKKSDIKVVSDISAGTFYEDRYCKQFSLFWKEYPYTIEYSYRIKSSKYIFVARWYPYYYTSVPVHKASLTVELPQWFKGRLYQQGKLDFKADTINKMLVYTWESKDLPLLREEYIAKPFYEVIPHVLAVPDEFDYIEKGELVTWQAFGNWVERLNSGLDILTPEEGGKVDALLKGISDPNEKIRILYHYLQDYTHYVNISIEVGGMKPYPASYVCTNKYGDCKALTIYMKALLRYAGIQSFYALVNAGTNAVQVDRSIPGSWFNHVILCVPIEKDTIWLENTSPYTPSGYLGSFTQARLALVVNGIESRLVQTPALRQEEVREISKYEFTLNQSGSGSSRITKQLRGKSFDNFSAYKVTLSEHDLHDKINEILPLNDFELTDWAFNEHNRDESWIGLICNGKVRNQIRQLGKTLVLTPVYDKLPELERPDKRVSPVRINYPIAWTDTLCYSISFTGPSTTILPRDVMIESKYGNYKFKAGEINGTIQIVREITINRGEYSLEEYKAFYDFYSALKDSLEKTYIKFYPG